MRCPELRGSRVALRSWRSDEAGWYVDARDEEVFRWTSEPPDLTPDVARLSFEYFEQVPGVYGFAIANQDTGELVGHLPISIDGDTAEVAYWLAPAQRGHGYLGEAIDLVLQWLGDIGVSRAVLEVHPKNAASRRAAERAGFTEIGERGSSKPFANTGTVVAYEQRLPRSARSPT